MHKGKFMKKNSFFPRIGCYEVKSCNYPLRLLHAFIKTFPFARICGILSNEIGYRLRQGGNILKEEAKP